MGCGVSTIDFDLKLHIPPQRLATLNYENLKKSYRDNNLNYLLFINSRNEAAREIEELKKNLDQDGFKLDLEEFWEKYENSLKSNFNFFSFKKTFFEQIAEFHIKHVFRINKMNIKDAVLGLIMNYIKPEAEEASKINKFLETQINSNQKLSLIYDYNNKKHDNFMYNNINSCLNFSKDFKDLSALTIIFDTTFPIDPNIINGIGEVIENKNIDFLNLIFTSNVTKYSERKVVIEHNINQILLVFLQAIRNSPQINSFYIIFKGTKSFLYNIVIDPLVCSFLIETLKIDKLINFGLIQLKRLENIIINSLCEVLKSLQRMKSLVLNIEELNDTFMFLKEVLSIKNLEILVLINKELVKENIISHKEISCDDKSAILRSNIELPED